MIFSFRLDFVYERWPVVTAIAAAILAFQAQNNDLHDGAVYSALESLAEMYRTLGSGIYYERPPNDPAARALYAQIAQSLQEFQKNGPGRSNLPRLKDSDIFQLLVFLLRVGKQESNGRSRSRAFRRFPARALPAACGRALSRRSTHHRALVQKTISVSAGLEVRILDNAEHISKRVVNRADEYSFTDVLHRFLRLGSKIEQMLIRIRERLSRPSTQFPRALAFHRRPTPARAPVRSRPR